MPQPPIIRLSGPRRVAKPTDPLPERESVADRLGRFVAAFESQLGHLGRPPLDGSLSPAEARVLWALGKRREVLASVLAGELGMDQGQLSRIVHRLDGFGWLKRESAEDGRAAPLTLTASGRTGYRRLVKQSARARVEALEAFSLTAQSELAGAMAKMQKILARGNAPHTDDPPMLRAPRPGEIAHIASRIASFKHRDLGLGKQYEAALLAEASAYMENFDRTRDIACVADSSGQVMGAITLRHELRGAARIGLFHTEPEARRSSLALDLLTEALDFARMVKYPRVHARVLGPQSDLTEALAKRGFKLTRTEKNTDFGAPVNEGVWEWERD